MKPIIKILILASFLILLVGCTFPKDYICVDIKPSGLEIQKVGEDKYEVEKGTVRFKIGECEKKVEVINETINLSQTPENTTILE